jgi:hypothetical protein
VAIDEHEPSAPIGALAIAAALFAQLAVLR